MSRVAIVSAYVFTAADGTAISTLPGGAATDWVDQNGGYSAIMRVTSNKFECPYGNPSDCYWNGTGAGSITPNQYVSVTLAGISNSDDSMGGILLSNKGVVGSSSTNSLYRFYYNDDTASPMVAIDRVINNVPTTIKTVAGALSNGNILSCEVTVSGGVPTFQLYVDTGSGPVALGTLVSDTSGQQLVSGPFGITARCSANTMLGGPFEGGNLVSSGGGITLPQLERSGFRGSFRGMR